MKYLGIDYGSKRVGLATSDEEGRMAFPHSVILNDKNLIDKIGEIIKKNKIEKIVTGESTNFAGQPNKIMADIKKFAEKLEKETGLEIIFEPEFMTSVQAEKLQGKNDMHDASAAALILQYYLDRDTKQRMHNE